MNKLVLFTFLLMSVFACELAQAQSLSVLTGLSYSTVQGPLHESVQIGTFNIDDAISPVVGLGLEVPIGSSHVALHISAIYTPKGHRVYSSICDAPGAGVVCEQPVPIGGAFRAKYIQTPIVLQISVPIRDLELKTTLGGYLGYRMGKSWTSSLLNSYPIDAGMEKFDYGANLGVAAELGVFQLGLEYRQGLKDLSMYFDTEKGKNRQLQATLAMQILSFDNN